MNKNELEGAFEAFEKACQGYYGEIYKILKTEFTYQYVDDTVMLSEGPEILERYFDYEAVGRDFFLERHAEITGFVFVD